MTNETQKIWIIGSVCMTFLLFIGVLAFTAEHFYNQWNDNKKIEFMNQHIPVDASRALLEWCEYYGFKKEWLWIFDLLMTESNGDRLAKSHADCKGYLQLSRRTALILKNRLKDKINKCGVYDTEFNIAGGILHLRNLYDNYCSQDLWLSIEVYNVGDYNYFTHGKRAPHHMKRFGINQTYFKFEWKKFKAIFSRLRD